MPNPFPLHTPAKRLLARAPQGSLPFLSVGMTGLATHSLIFTTLFHVVGLNDKLAWLISICIATSVTWVLNRRLSFAPSGRGRAAEAVRLRSGHRGVAGDQLCGLPWPGRGGSPSAAHPGADRGRGVATIFSYTGQRFFTFAAPKTITGEPVISDIPVA